MLFYKEIKKFNWGAFLLGWFWGIFNKSYKTLWQLPISLIPQGGAVVSFFISIYFGINGNKWALENKQFNSLDDFQKYQRLFAVIGFLVSVFYTVVFFLNIIHLKMNILFPSNNEYDFNLITLKIKLAKYFLYVFLIILFIALYIFSTKIFNKKICTVVVILYFLMMTAAGEYLIRIDLPKIEKSSIVNEKSNQQSWGLYMRQIQHKIKNNLNKLAFPEGISITLTFNIDKKGAISDIVIIESSGSSRFDAEVLSVIEKSAPFPIIPNDYKVNGIRVRFTAQKDVISTSVVESY